MSARIHDQHARAVAWGDVYRESLERAWTVLFWAAFYVLPGIGAFATWETTGVLFTHMNATGRLIVQVGLSAIAVLGVLFLMLAVRWLANTPQPEGER